MAARRPLVLAAGQLRELPDGDLLPAAIVPPYVPKRVSMGAATVIDLAAGDIFEKTITGATAFTVANMPVAPQTAAFVLELTNGSAGAVTYPSGTVTADGSALPSLSAGKTDRLGFIGKAGGGWILFKMGIGAAS